VITRGRYVLMIERTNQMTPKICAVDICQQKTLKRELGRGLLVRLMLAFVGTYLSKRNRALGELYIPE